MAVIIAKKQDIIDIADIVREKSGLTEKMSFKGIYDAINEYMPEQPKSYLTFSSPSAFSISVSTPGWNGTMEYSTDKTNWTEWDGSKISGVAVNDGYTVYLRGMENTVITGVDNSTYAWTLTGSNISCNGNIETLLDYKVVQSGNSPTMMADCYYAMFYGCTSLTTAPELPATELTDSCYSHMFHGCTSLTTAPELPATTLASYCYQHMFRDCYSLTQAPVVLPATTLSTYCYGCMFQNCASLTQVPVLPATMLANYCYAHMFQNCTNLTQAPVLPATALKLQCYAYMFAGCYNLTQAPNLPATTLANYCYTYMFQNCILLTTAPELPATTLTSYCYQYMFYGCTSLIQAPALSATTLNTYCYQYMFYGCANLTQVPELPATTLTSCCYRYMFTGCTSIELSSTQTDDYTQEYRIPTSGTGSTATNALTNMFASTGGTFTGTPTINTTYYLHKDCTII